MPKPPRGKRGRTAKSKSNIRRHRRTARRGKSCGLGGVPNKRAIVEFMFEMLHNVKLYHWNTHSFSQHKATDELHGRLSEHVDKFVEVLLGKSASQPSEGRLRHLNEKIALINSRNTREFRDKIHEYREYFIGMADCFDSHKDSDLLNIRDEILADLNQFLYLLTLQ